MTTSYGRGRNFEYRCKAYLESQGYEVKRSLMSRGPYDLIAKKPGEIRLIQCKKTKDGYIRPAERKELLDAADEFRKATPDVIRTESAHPGKVSIFDKRKIPIVFKEVTA